MKKGYLSSYFQGVAIKTLSEVETNIAVSHQHEINGVSALKKILGTSKLENIPVKYIYVDDDEYIESSSIVTWYEARGGMYPRNAVPERQRYRSEYRLYFKGTEAMTKASPNDILVIAKYAETLITESFLLIIIAKAETTIASQILWLFNCDDKTTTKFSIKDTVALKSNQLKFMSNLILEKIGVQPQTEDDNYLEDMIRRFGHDFPSTNEFSAYARSRVHRSALLDSPDSALQQWMEMEETLFRTFDRHLLESKLRTCIGDTGQLDVDGMRQFFMSSFQSSKSRAGRALENHMEYIFQKLGISYTRNGITENKNKPDFIFPNIEKYHDNNFPAQLLSMLGLKTTSKDRWRQILPEADRISDKHLLTLEPRISKDQTDEMERLHVHLVVPLSLQEDYMPTQRLMSVQDFIAHLHHQSKKQYTDTGIY